MSVSYGGDVITFADSTTLGSAKTQWKNRIINGNMIVNQRYGTTLQTGLGASNSFLIDRFRLGGNGMAGRIDVQRVADGPATESGMIRNSLKITVNSSYTITSSDNILLSTMLEGQDIADFGMGTSAAKTVTLSFYVKSSNTGTYCVSFGDDTSIGYSSTYTITQANTWERKSITIPGTASGTNWTTDSTFSCRMNWTLGAGSAVTGTLNQWTFPISYQGSGCTNFVSQAAGSTWQITGIQLELGSTATTFENRPYQQELQMCQRYYWRNVTQEIYNPFAGGYTFSSTSFTTFMPFPVQMRSRPTGIGVSGATDFFVQSTNNYTSSAVAFNRATLNGCSFSVTITGATAGQAGNLLDRITGAWIEFTGAEF